MKALLVIDVQNDFCPGGSLAVPEGDKIIPGINKITSHFDIVAATRDWHPKGHVSFASSHGKIPGDSIDRPEGPQILWPNHCVCGSTGADFHPDLRNRDFNIILNKGSNSQLDSYSAFFENDKKTPTGLSFYLKGLGVTEVYLCGLATDYCVFFSALDSLKEGFSTTLLLDCCRGVNIPEGSVEKAVITMKKSGIRIINTGDLTF